MIWKKHLKRVLNFTIIISLIVFTVSIKNLWATEGGGSAYSGGNEDFMSGALPPPGQYLINYFQYYTADKLRDNSGNKTPIDTSIQATANALRFIYVTKKKVFGADLGWHVIVPLVNLHISLDTPGRTRQTKTGLGDIEFSPFILGWHFKNFHMVGTIDFMVPTGAYDKNDTANIGRNYWTINPIFDFTYLADKGFEVSAKFLYLINTTNTATGYKSGNEFIVDYLIGQHIGNWKFGVNGYYYKQITDDRMRNEPVNFNGNKGQTLSIGPAIQYNHKNMFFNIKYQLDTNVKNRSEGQKLWFKYMYAF